MIASGEMKKMIFDVRQLVEIRDIMTVVSQARSIWRTQQDHETKFHDIQSPVFAGRGKAKNAPGLKECAEKYMDYRTFCVSGNKSIP